MASFVGISLSPNGKPDRLRTEHLETIRTRTVICQGERDPSVRLTMSRVIRSRSESTFRLTDGDHGFKPRKASGRTEQDNWSEAIDMLLGFIDG